MTEEEMLKSVLQQVSAGLDAFEQFLAKPENIQTAQRAFADRSMPAEEFFKTVPTGVVQTLLALRIPHSFEQLRDYTPAESRSRLEQLRNQALAHFDGVEIHPAVVRRVAEIAKRATPTRHEGSSTDFDFNTINSITWLPLWAEANGGISPMVRLAFAEQSKGQLLDTTLNTDGLIYVVSTLTSILAEELERIGSSKNKTLFPPGFVEDLDKERMEKLLRSSGRIERAWSVLRETEAAD